MEKIKLNTVKKIIVSAFVLVDDDIFDVLNKYRWTAADHKHTRYAVRCENGKIIYMHRQILGLGFDDKLVVDHIDFNGLNNQKNNLRAVTRAQNNANISPRKNSTSKYLGVYWNKKNKKWNCQLTKNGKTYNLGYFINEMDAANAYNKKAIEIHKEFANLNQTG